MPRAAVSGELADLVPLSFIGARHREPDHPAWLLKAPDDPPFSHGEVGIDDMAIRPEGAHPVRRGRRVVPDDREGVMDGIGARGAEPLEHEDMPAGMPGGRLT